MRPVASLLLALCLSGSCGPPVLDSPAGPATDSPRSQSVPSSRPGMGANVYSGGTTFRVYAPNASSVAVAGEWNGFSMTAHPLASEGNGNFSADVPGATAGQRYKFVLRHAGTDLWKPDPRARRMTNSTGESIIVDPAAYSWHDGGYHTPSFNEAVLYEMHLGSFNPPGGRPPGGWSSAAAKLDYLRDLGINFIELTPIFEFPTDISTGYNPSFPFAPESAYGTPEDFKSFVDQAHARGIGVLIDVVHNHWGPSDLPLWCFDGECYGAGGVYFYTDWRRETDWGPRPDFGRAQVRDYIRDAVVHLLNEYHVDGVRWDATMSIREAGADGWNLLQRVNHESKAAQPWKLLIAEDFRDNAAITLPTTSGGAGFDSQWDGGFFHPVTDAVRVQNDRDRDMGAVAGAIARVYNGQATQRVIYTESHDEVSNGRQRLPEMIWPGNAGSYFSKKRSTLAAAVALTSPGIPMLFMGQEFLQDGWYAPERPLNWARAGWFGGIVSLYRDLIHLRRNFNNNTRGLRGDHVNVFHVNHSNKMIAYHRWQVGGGGDDVVVVTNFAGSGYSAYHVGLPRCGTWFVRFNSDYNGYSPDFGNWHAYDAVARTPGADGMPCAADIGIGPYTALILSQ